MSGGSGGALEMKDSVAELQREIGLLRAALKAVQWGREETVQECMNVWTAQTCPACHAAKNDGHRAGCIVAVALEE